MAEGIVTSMARGYVDPRAAMARQIAGGLSEPRALGHLFLACALWFIASVPAALRRAQDLDGVPDPLAGAVTAHVFGYIFVAPLLLYGLAGVLHLAARAFGGSGAFLGARSALFWAALLGAPIALALSSARVIGEIAAGPRSLPWISYLGYAGAAVWLRLLAASLAEAEGFRSTLRVAAMLALGLVVIVVGIRALAVSAQMIG